MDPNEPEQIPSIDEIEIGDRQLPCPVCGEAMQEQRHGGVSIDACEAHGVWLDDGELETIAMRIRRRVGRRARRRERDSRRRGRVQGAAFGWWSMFLD